MLKIEQLLQKHILFKIYFTNQNLHQEKLKLAHFLITFLKLLKRFQRVYFV